MIPALKKSVRIREEPEGAVFINMETNKYSFVSSFEAFILALFDGTRTIDDITNNFKMLKNCPTEKEIQNDIYSIIQTRTELIELVKTPLKKGRVKLDPYTFLLKQNIFLKPSRASAPLAVDLYVTRKVQFELRLLLCKCKTRSESK